jgi:hypothetical protein
VLGALQAARERTGASVNVAGPLLAIVASPTLVEQILSNLLAQTPAMAAFSP